VSVEIARKRHKSQQHLQRGAGERRVVENLSGEVNAFDAETTRRFTPAGFSLPVLNRPRTGRAR
jgi:hypothetical protein